MKKNTALTNIFITFFLLSACALSFAENSTDENNTTTQNETPEDNSATTPKEQTKIYAIPQPQASRISALKESLNLHNNGHQIEILEANEEPFLTLYQAPLTRSNEGCLIILHADNEHPNWPDAIAPIRNTMPQYSWCTISIEVPDAIKRAAPVNPQLNKENNQEILELPNQDMVFERIMATIENAQNKDITQFALLGYKTGATYALYFLANNITTAEALILIDIEALNTTSQYDIAQQIRNIPQPILDYHVKNSQFAQWRQQAANQRTEIKGNFIQLAPLPDRTTGKENEQLLVQRVRGFLKQNTSQINQRKTLPSVEKGLFYASP